jgi:hypothetical protein
MFRLEHHRLLHSGGPALVTNIVQALKYMTGINALAYGAAALVTENVLLLLHQVILHWIRDGPLELLVPLDPGVSDQGFKDLEKVGSPVGVINVLKYQCYKTFLSLTLLKKSWSVCTFLELSNVCK